MKPEYWINGRLDNFQTIFQLSDLDLESKKLMILKLDFSQN